ncbi:MAG: DUF2029 domain-containing protein [Ardenticatenales bacterium]|nr:DUF2029 domain-containing protein [Ardenticatenales bacterium]
MERLRWVALVLFLLVYGWCVLLPAASASTGGFAGYYTSAWILARYPDELARVYEDAWFVERLEETGIEGVYDIFFIHPPTMTLLLLPLTAFPPATARVIWTGVNLALLVGGLLLLARALRLSWQWGLWLTPFALLYTPVIENFRYGQGYLLLFCLICLLLWAHLTGRRTAAGLVLGQMLLLKTAALWLWPLFLLSKQWRLLVVALLVAGGAVGALLPLFGLEPWQRYALLLPQLGTLSQRYVTAYQTVTSLLGHLFIYDEQWNPTPVIHLPLLARLLTLAVQFGTLFFSWRWARLEESRHEVRVLTLALFLSLVVANGPLGEQHHYAMVLPALLIALWWARHHRVAGPGWAWLLLSALLLGAPLPFKALQLQAGLWALLAYPRVYGAFLLWGWVGWQVTKSQKSKVQKT